jgi:hypothetical protein
VARLCGFLRRGADLAGEITGQALVARIDLGPDIGMAAEQVLDAVGAQRGDIMHPPRPERSQPQQPALAVADRGGLDGVLLLPDTNARRLARPTRGRRSCTSVPSIRSFTPRTTA